MSNFLDDCRNLIVNDASINARYSPRIYFQLLPKDIDKDKVWLRWGFTQTDSIECIGGGVAYNNYSLFIDVLSKTINDLPDMGDEIVQNFNGSNYEGRIINLNFDSDVYSNYQEKDIYVRTLNFSVTYK